MDDDLVALAAAHGVATWYEDGNRERVDVAPDVVADVLALLDVDASTPASVRAELNRVRARAAEDRLPPTIVLRQGATRPVGAGELRCEDGTSLAVDGELPADLPLGWHELRVGSQVVTVVVAPPALPEPPRAWGWMLQLYAVRSAESWGMGDLADLAEFTRWAGEYGAGMVLVNPLHAPNLVEPVEPSPYSPSSRQFVNPLYLRIEHTDAYARADAETRAQVDSLRAPNGDRIDYDEVWRAKRAALELLWPFAEVTEPDAALRTFATFCVIAEKHGPDWRTWPEELRHPRSVRLDNDRVRFHVWLQQLCFAQLSQARQGVRVVHDLAVGVNPAGADGWMLQDVLAKASVGAPPDEFNQQGQNWGLPPWRPDRLAEQGYRPYRDVLRAVLRHADGIRIDHVAGLWRLWWVPEGSGPERGTYVHYDAEAMLGVLALEAHRANAVVIGEDLGTVEPEVTEALHAQNMLGSTVVWFQRDHEADGRPLIPPAAWPANAVASISTHDLPTAPGFLSGEHVRVRSEIGVLARPLAEEQAHADAERADFLSLLRSELLLGHENATDDEIVVALHGLLVHSPCRVLLISPYDLVGEVRQPNLPGTVTEYPNWKLPLPLTLPSLYEDPRVRKVIELLNPLS
ncbi:4-alpha-glucanotransferase [Allokutzneria sp. A3M-2-11 16]|uniref:4-alpha-glucanotransferase n=1 Tax=Allokutzneria sp. A3M-2-11 16 TaxID=2962043 RepID=UPI0020B8249E|nr:4-alpha-glucanotransferase [Allokutzneria sp. A3M-2-11 16]MCP3802858.1 4-alpha-glucanotransferase [Allokutzneria sp. A3M-2-11 16]